MEEHKNSYCVYKHTNLINNKIYIGITSQNPPEKRWMNGFGYQGNKHFWRAIQKFGWDNFKHEILFYNLTKQEACKKEIELIAYFNSTDERYGYNVSHGGEAVAQGLKRSEETKMKHRKNAALRRGRYGEEYRICQFDLSGQLIKIYDWPVEAADEMHTGSQTIIDACEMHKSYKGYVWRYYFDAKSYINKMRKLKENDKISQFTLDLKFVRTYLSVESAYFINRYDLHCTKTKIAKCVNYELDSAYGYVWRPAV